MTEAERYQKSHCRICGCVILPAFPYYKRRRFIDGAHPECLGTRIAEEAMAAASSGAKEEFEAAYKQGKKL